MASRREVITAATCRSCGACCVNPYEQDSWADVDGQDMARMGRRVVRLHVLKDNNPLLGPDAFGAIKTIWKDAHTGPYKDLRFLQCELLRGSPFSQVSCTIYNNRPKACREAVKPGNQACRELRQGLKEKADEQQQGR